MEILALSGDDRDWVEKFVVEHWGAPIVVGRGTTWRPAELPGFAAYEGEEPVGLATYEIEDDACELVTIDALVEGEGVGTALLEAVKEAARNEGCTRVRLVTTNNNVRALLFYQKRGFRLVALIPGGVAELRKLKPSIPEVDAAGLPIRDELHLELRL